MAKKLQMLCFGQWFHSSRCSDMCILFGLVGLARLMVFLLLVLIQCSNHDDHLIDAHSRNFNFADGSKHFVAMRGAVQVDH